MTVERGLNAVGGLLESRLRRNGHLNTPSQYVAGGVTLVSIHWTLIILFCWIQAQARFAPNRRCWIENVSNMPKAEVSYFFNYKTMPN